MNSSMISNPTHHSQQFSNGEDRREFLSLRCQSSQCKKLLGKMDKENGVLHIESSRSGWWISIKLERGTILCKKCGNELHWDHTKLGEKNGD